jgi:surface antigen
MTGTLAAVGSIAALSFGVAEVGAAAGSSLLVTGESLRAGESIVSPNGQFRLVMQGDGNLVLYTSARAMWSTATAGSGATRAVLQGDGNLVLYSSTRAVWSSVTAGKPVKVLVVQDDGNVVLYGGSTAYWSSRTLCDYLAKTGTLSPGHYLLSPDRRFRAVMQGDGNFVVYEGGTARWSTGSAGSGANRMVLQADGNLVLYSPTRAVWNSRTAGSDSSRLAMQSDGNLVLYGAGARWSSQGGLVTAWPSSFDPRLSAYPYRTGAMNVTSPYGYATRNCTDYVAWWLASRGVSAAAYRGNGNAIDWPSRTRGKANIVQTTSPRAGDIACVTSEGHVALVTSVSGSNVNLAEYNVPGGSGNPNTRTKPRSFASVYLRFTELRP